MKDWMHQRGHIKQLDQPERSNDWSSSVTPLKCYPNMKQTISLVKHIPNIVNGTSLAFHRNEAHVDSYKVWKKIVFIIHTD